MKTVQCSRKHRNWRTKKLEWLKPKETDPINHIQIGKPWRYKKYLDDLNTYQFSKLGSINTTNLIRGGVNLIRVHIMVRRSWTIVEVCRRLSKNLEVWSCDSSLRGRAPRIMSVQRNVAISEAEYNQDPILLLLPSSTHHQENDCLKTDDRYYTACSLQRGPRCDHRPLRGLRHMARDRPDIPRIRNRNVYHARQIRSTVPPLGELFIARNTNGLPIGCVGLRPLYISSSSVFTPTTCCEMKRLYVTAEGRGTGVGSALITKVIQTAKDFGYAEMKLDTLPRMTGAIKLYRNAGFEEVEKYYDTPLVETIFFRLTLNTIQSK